ncbi:MAG: hypothetical protein ACSHWN_05495 [Methylophilaceae bacterium]
MKAATIQQTIRTIKTNTCKSLSSKSKLEYQIGCLGDSDLSIRITKNSGGGWYSGEWISIKRIIGALESSNQPLTSYAIQTLFNGKSVNTAAFLFATLKEEGLLVASTDNPRTYVLQPVGPFVQTLKSLAKSPESSNAKS